MSMKSFAVGVVCGVLASSVVAMAAEKIGVTDVRVGPTAAIGITTSADGSILYVVNGSGLFKSADGGATWTKLQVE